jgi:integrase
MDKLNDANDRLKPLKISLLSRGNRLSVRSTLPNKPGKPTGRSQQTIALNLPCTPSGINRAEKVALKIANDRDLGLFRWEDYQTGKQSLCNPLEEAIDKHRTFYTDRGGKLSTWQAEYHRFYRHLEGLTEQDFIKVITATEPNTRIRQKAVVACNALVSHVGLGFNFSPYRGDYSPYTSAEEREIPDDKTITQTYQMIPNPAWQWVYGMIATYGLRNHEVFRCDASDLELLKIESNSKTGEHYAVSFPEEWIKLFNLEAPIIPPLDLTRSNKALGNAVTQQFKRYGIPFTPYSLRHAWAIRTWRAGWPDSDSAKAMGHSVQVHYRIYQRWTGTETRREIYQRLKRKNP